MELNHSQTRRHVISTFVALRIDRQKDGWQVGQRALAHYSNPHVVLCVCKVHIGSFNTLRAYCRTSFRWNLRVDKREIERRTDNSQNNIPEPLAGDNNMFYQIFRK